MDRPGHLLVAYHGCDESVRDLLLSPGEETIDVTQSRNPYDWLGTGAYFFEDDWGRALHFAQLASEHPKLTKGSIGSASVVGAVIRVHRWLDLATSEGRFEYNVAVVDLQNRGIKLQRNGPSQNQLGKDDILRRLDRQVINHIHRMRASMGRPAYDAVRSYFPQGDAVSASSAFQQETHVQFALRNPRCVLGYFRVRDAEVRAF